MAVGVCVCGGCNHGGGLTARGAGGACRPLPPIRSYPHRGTAVSNIPSQRAWGF